MKYIIELPDSFKGEVPTWCEPYDKDEAWKRGHAAGLNEGIMECRRRFRQKFGEIFREETET